MIFMVFVLPGVGSSWRSVGAGAQPSLSLAGWWFVMVSQPLYNFVVLCFAYRVVLWWRFLWQTARLDLRLNAAHADKAGGLAFLGQTLAPVAVTNVSSYTSAVAARKRSAAGRRERAQREG